MFWRPERTRSSPRNDARKKKSQGTKPVCQSETFVDFREDVKLGGGFKYVLFSPLFG